MQYISGLIADSLQRFIIDESVFGWPGLARSALPQVMVA